jgi:hypothetical protein
MKKSDGVLWLQEFFDLLLAANMYLKHCSDVEEDEGRAVLWGLQLAGEHFNTKILVKSDCHGYQ